MYVFGVAVLGYVSGSKSRVKCMSTVLFFYYGLRIVPEQSRALITSSCCMGNHISILHKLASRWYGR